MDAMLSDLGLGCSGFDRVGFSSPEQFLAWFGLGPTCWVSDCFFCSSDSTNSTHLHHILSPFSWVERRKKKERKDLDLVNVAGIWLCLPRKILNAHEWRHHVDTSADVDSSRYKTHHRSYMNPTSDRCVKKNRLVVSLYNVCTASTLYLYSVTQSPTRLQHQAIWSPTRLQHQALNSRGTSISNILPRSQPSKIEIVLKI
jgi:hypothetical protein